MSSTLFTSQTTHEKEEDNLRQSNTELRKLLDERTSELTSLQRRIVYFESALVESNTLAAVGFSAARTFDSEMKALEEENAARVRELQDRLRLVTERHRIAPNLDQNIFMTLLELRSSLTDKLRAPAMADNERAKLEGSSPLVVLDELRFWVRRTLDQVDVLQAALTKAADKARNEQARASESNQSFSGGSPDGLYGGAGTMRRVSVANLRRMSAVQRDGAVVDGGSTGTGGAPLARRGSYAPGSKRDIELLRSSLGDAVRVRDELSAEVVSLKAALTATQRDTADLQEKLKAQNTAVREEAAALRQVNRGKDKALRDVQKELQRHKVAAVSVVALENAQHEVKSARQIVKIAIQAKQQELDAYKQKSEETITALKLRINHLEKRITNANLLTQEVDVAREDAKSARSQLVRANVKGLLFDKDKLLGTLQKHAARITQLETDLIAREGAHKYLEATHRALDAKYKEVIAKQDHDLQVRRKEQGKRRVVRAERETLGPNSELNAEYYRTRYYEAVRALRIAQGQMKKLIVIAHQERLTADKQREALVAELDAIEAQMATTKMSSLMRPQSAPYSRVELTTAPTEMKFSPSPAPVVERTSSDIEQQKELERWMQPNPEGSSTILSPSIRIGVDRAAIDMSIPSIGAENEFGNPMEYSEVLRVHTELPMNEVSLRSLRTVSPGGVADHSSRSDVDEERSTGRLEADAGRSSVVRRIGGKRFRLPEHGGVIHLRAHADEGYSSFQSETAQRMQAMARPASAPLV